MPSKSKNASAASKEAKQLEKLQAELERKKAKLDALMKSGAARANAQPAPQKPKPKPKPSAKAASGGAEGTFNFDANTAARRPVSGGGGGDANGSLGASAQAGPAAPGSPSNGGRELRVNSFSFDPEDDPVVCKVVQTYAQQAAARRAAMEAERAEKEREAAAAANAPPSPREVRLKREREKEARLAAKRKFAEISSGITRLAGKVVESAETREALSGAFSLTLVPIRPRSRGARRSLRTFPGASLRPGSLAFDPRPRRL
ncbi:uncharacterized protein MICPUCDRAFT_69844 [Micromonas pusilla CCMP1545]|uniref:Predicted protein n=1 Tax=Micromonas pusilla (strain CCMP1545) TaxID=564608 RepID=C1N2H3_MICPC|nr:uncharacterized protein MICPUCDRAFT_69844 [Micromonas pusilla CCMP1545]EEH53801.1 predicted protein [Micromonas pusilla CCMP1545]|eukprot:XP_003062089.1 predicted protein [Micromonas pusilla CCMP1545]